MNSVVETAAELIVDLVKANGSSAVMSWQAIDIASEHTLKALSEAIRNQFRMADPEDLNGFDVTLVTNDVSEQVAVAVFARLAEINLDDVLTASEAESAELEALEARSLDQWQNSKWKDGADRQYVVLHIAFESEDELFCGEKSLVFREIESGRVMYASIAEFRGLLTEVVAI